MKTLLSKNSNVIPVLLEESSWQIISPVRFEVKPKFQFVPLVKKVEADFKYERPPQVLKILDPEQRVQLMYDYTKSRKENAKLISFEKFISMDRIDK